MQPEASTDKKTSQLQTVIKVRLYSRVIRVALSSQILKPNPKPQFPGWDTDRRVERSAEE